MTNNYQRIKTQGSQLTYFTLNIMTPNMKFWEHKQLDIFYNINIFYNIILKIFEKVSVLKLISRLLYIS